MISRRTFAKGIVSAATSSAALALHVRVGRAADFNYKLANGFPATHPLNLRAAEAISRIRDETGGRLEITLFPASQLGADTDSLGQLRSGALEFYASTTGVFSSLSRTASIANMPFIWSGYDALWPKLDGNLGSIVKGGFDALGLTVIGNIWDNGFRQMTSGKKPIEGVESMAGFKIRVPNSPVNLSVFKALGASPVTINIPELYSALQTGLVDGQENPLSIIEGNRLNEVQQFCAISNHIWDGSLIVANAGIWKALPPDIQAIAEKCFIEAGLAQRSDVQALNLSIKDKLEKSGLKFNQVEPAPFREALTKAGFYVEWKEKFGAEAWQALENEVGKLI